MIYHPQQVLEDVTGQLDYNRRSYRPTQTAINSDKSQSKASYSSAAPHVDKLLLAAGSEQPSANIKSSRDASRNESAIPEHLMPIYEHLDWHGQDLDALVIATHLAPPQLIGQLMELELMGVISVQGGRYLRV